MLACAAVPPATDGRRPDRLGSRNPSSSGSTSCISERVSAPATYGCPRCGIDGVRFLSAFDIPFVMLDGEARVIKGIGLPLSAALAGQLAQVCADVVARLTGASQLRSPTSDRPMKDDAERVEFSGEQLCLRAVTSGQGASCVVAVWTPTSTLATIRRDVGFACLTNREREVAELLADGVSTRAIAHAFGSSVHTVRRRTERIYAKLGVVTRTQLVLSVQRARSER